MLNSVTKLYVAPIFECYVIKCGSKNGYQKDTCLKVIGLCAQNIIAILS